MLNYTGNRLCDVADYAAASLMLLCSASNKVGHGRRPQTPPLSRHRLMTISAAFIMLIAGAADGGGDTRTGERATVYDRHRITETH